MNSVTAIYNSPLGPITLTLDGEALTGLTLGARGMPSARSTTASSAYASIWRTRPSALPEVHRWLTLYFSCQQPDFTPPLALHGTPFQLRVWQALLEIPYGETSTYGEIARRIGCRSAQAVGQAVGKNPIAIIVPCHRVVGSDGSLTGYAYGVEKKEYLLQSESRHRLAVTG